MKIFSYIPLLIFLWFSNEVKAKGGEAQIDSSLSDIWVFISNLRLTGSNYIKLPFSCKTNFGTFYDFDLGLIQRGAVYLARSFKYKGYSDLEPPEFLAVNVWKRYPCKNEATSFFLEFYFCISKRKKIKKFFERVDFCFDFSLSLLDFKVALLTKDGKILKFFHLPESIDVKEQKDRWRPFRFSFDCIKFPYNSFLRRCGYSKKDVESVIDKIFSFLYCVASCFSFCFDNIMICPYLFCCIKFPIEGVFFFFFILKYLLLKKEFKELLAEHNKKEDGKDKDALRKLLEKKEEKTKSIPGKCLGFLVQKLTQSLNFSIRF